MSEAAPRELLRHQQQGTQQVQPAAAESDDAGQQRAVHAVPTVFDVLGAPKQLSAEAQKAAQSMHHGDSFGQYMALKVTKLREQYESNSLHTTAQSDLFKGISIIVNGYTQPSAQELKQIMLLHGGRFENYMYRDQVTHMICSNLPDTKLKQMSKERNPLPVVRPEWIVASLQAGRVLPIKDFQLLPKPDVPGQRKLLAHRQYDAPLPPAEQLYPQLQQQHAAEVAQVCTPAPKVVQPQPQPQPLMGPALMQVEGIQRVSHDELHLLKPQQGPAADQHEQQQQAGGVCDAVSAMDHAGQVERQSPMHLLGGTSPNMQQQPSVPLTAAAAVCRTAPVPSGNPEADMRTAQELCAQLRAACDVLKGAPKSSDANPNFMEDFFRSSRLHFIGTWKARIEALMAEHDGAGPRPQQPTAKGIASFWQPAAATSSSAPKTSNERVYVHIDMDCFFASVAAAAYPILLGKPLVVSHSASTQGRGEVSAASYEARAYGICATMAIGEAKQLCPDLLVVPYMFDKYQAVSEQVYNILLQYSSCVQPLSCDEAYLDVTGLGDPEQLAAALRADIYNTTGCPASAGIGPNLLVARLATKKAKPNGQFRVQPQQVMDFLADLPVDSLPGVGWSLNAKLQDMGITRVRQLRGVSKEQLQRQLGSKTGATLWGYAHGKDERVVEPPKARKSVGAEVNWGIRFTGPEDVTKFLAELAQEVVQRLKAAGVRGKSITLKVKRRQAGAPPPWKMLGHGPCDNLSRSVTLGAFTDSATDIAIECGHLMAALNIPPEDIRGVGIAVTKLNTDTNAQAAHPTTTAPAKLQARSPRPYDRDRVGAWPSLHELTEEQSAHAVRTSRQAGAMSPTVDHHVNQEPGHANSALQGPTGAGATTAAATGASKDEAAHYRDEDTTAVSHQPLQVAAAKDVVNNSTPALAEAAAAARPAAQKRLFSSIFESAAAAAGSNKEPAAAATAAAPPAKRVAFAGSASLLSRQSHLQTSVTQPGSSGGLAAALAKLHAAAAAAAASREPSASGITSTAAAAQQSVWPGGVSAAALEASKRLDADMLDANVSSAEEEEEQQEEEEGGGEYSGVQAQLADQSTGTRVGSGTQPTAPAFQHVSWFDQGSRTGFEVTPAMPKLQHKEQRQLQHAQELQERQLGATSFAHFAAQMQPRGAACAGQAQHTAGVAAVDQGQSNVLIAPQAPSLLPTPMDAPSLPAFKPAVAVGRSGELLGAAEQPHKPALAQVVMPVAVTEARGEMQHAVVAAPQAQPPPAAAAQLPPASCIDPAVLAELPDDVRRELQAAYGLDLVGLPPAKDGHVSMAKHASHRPTGPAKHVSGSATRTHSGASSGGAHKQATTSNCATSSHAARGQMGRSYFSRAKPSFAAGVAAVQRQQRIHTKQQQQPQVAVFEQTGDLQGTAQEGGHGTMRGEDAHGRVRGRDVNMAAPLTMSQVDPAVLAELPEDVRREVLASLQRAQPQGRRHVTHTTMGKPAACNIPLPGPRARKQLGRNVLAGGRSLPAVAVNAPGRFENQLDVQQVDVVQQPAKAAAAAAAAVQSSNQGAQQFEEEPLNAILRAFRGMVDQLLGAGGGCEDSGTAARPSMGTAQGASVVAVETELHAAGGQAHDATAPGLEAQQSASAAAGATGTGLQAEPAAVNQRTAEDAQRTAPAQAGLDKDDVDNVQAPAHPGLPVAVRERLQLGCEYLCKWVSCHGWDLEAQGAVLGMLCQLRQKWPMFESFSTPCETAIQQQAAACYGIVLHPVSLLD